MAYSLNTNASTQKITLSSTGTYTGSIYRPSFTLSKAIALDERLLHVCGLEIAVLKHPTYFHLNYMNGEVIVTSPRGTVRPRLITQVEGQENFSPFLQGVYITNDTMNVALLDAVLFNLLDFLKQLISDTGYGINFVFNGYPSTAYKYNSMSSDGMELIDNYDDPDNSLHVDLLYNFYRAQDFRFLIENSSEYKLEMKGNFLAMFGLDPNITALLPANGFLDVRLPIYGHDYICLSSNIGSNILSSTCGERLQTTNLFSIIPTPNYPAQLEVYTPNTDGGKTETSSNIIDLIELHFTDKYGNDVLSLEDFILTIVVDQVKTEDLPNQDHVSLDKVRKNKANYARDLNIQEMNKKLRI